VHESYVIEGGDFDSKLLNSVSSHSSNKFVAQKHRDWKRPENEHAKGSREGPCVGEATRSRRDIDNLLERQRL